jgi:hypothetical protein
MFAKSWFRCSVTVGLGEESLDNWRDPGPEELLSGMAESF